MWRDAATEAQGGSLFSFVGVADAVARYSAVQRQHYGSSVRKF